MAGGYSGSTYFERTCDLDPETKKPRNFLQGFRIVVPRPGIEPGTRGFSIRCSTN
ncbi:hypothetical protein GPUN_1909 [Glaciecola punicea ACAM 611]|uniref:Uncharacterized protein n=1 Tax=Glaciecola punicea ACAM 611 TaxID=1121923 RepID=H5TCJ8_9ALTE|nr:hypothetical protein GPUN_1909 [Glaciecola punicea ACAM 611]